MVLVLDTLIEKVFVVVDWNEMYDKMVEVPSNSIQIETKMQNYLVDKELIYQQISLLVEEKHFV
jgi:hypothetical protein